MNQPIVRFQILVCDLLNQTRFHSSNDIMRRTPAFRELVEMGEEIIPWIIEKYRNDPFIVWSLLLEEITKELPLLPVHEDGFMKTDVFATQQAWLEWYECRV